MSEIDTPALSGDAVLWSTEPEDRGGRPLLVLLHGYGSDEHDLFGLRPYLPSEATIAAVRAPLTPPWPAPGYSWYPIEGLDGRDPSRVTDAARRVIEWVDALPGNEPVGLLGFSQGAAVSMQALRLEPHRFAFAVNLSGYVAPGDLEGDAAMAELRPPVFWGRGTHDDVIPPALVEHTIQWLPSHATLSGGAYPGLTHSVSEQELSDVREFLDAQLTALRG